MSKGGVQLKVNVPGKHAEVRRNIVLVLLCGSTAVFCSVGSLRRQKCIHSLHAHAGLVQSTNCFRGRYIFEVQIDSV